MSFPVLLVLFLSNQRGFKVEFEQDDFLREGDKCSLANGSTGICTKADACTGLTDKIQDGEEPEVCFYNKFASYVCCPEESPTPSKAGTPLQASAGVSTLSPIPTTQRSPAFTPLPEQNRVGISKTEEACQENYSILQRVKSSSITEECEDFYYDGPGVVGGEDAFPREFPHMAALGFDIDNTTAWLCGGSLISNRYVLTAAHCAVPMRVGLVKWVRLGDLDLDSSTDDARPQQFAVAERIIHPDYNHPAYYNDIALLRLDRDVQFTAYVRPACLNTDLDLEDEVGDATGWGLTSFGGSLSSILQKATLPVQPTERCVKNYQSSSGTRFLPRGYNETVMLCVGDTQGERDTCQGDSGGPYHRPIEYRKCLHVIAGLTSFGKTVCGAVNSPAVYTRVSSFIPWIESVVWP